MSEGYAILSPDWTYLFVNKVNADQAHSTPEEIIGRSMLKVIPGVEVTILAAYRRCMEERTPQRVEAAFRSRAAPSPGSRRWRNLSPEEIFGAGAGD